MRIMCARDEAVAQLMCTKVEVFIADLPVPDRAMEFMSWKEHGCRWTESLMRGVIPGDLNRLFTPAMPCEGQTVLGGHDLHWGRCVRPKESPAHSDHSIADA